MQSDNDRPRSIRFPQSLWDAIDRDADACKRSAVKQMEAILSEYYRLAQTDLHHGALSTMRGDMVGANMGGHELQGTPRQQGIPMKARSGQQAKAIVPAKRKRQTG